MATMQRVTVEKRATDVGSYYVAPRATSTQLRAHLRSLALTTFKAASIGGEQEQGFEQSFSSLAYSYLKDKSPRLLDFIVGFQLVDRNEDNTKAMGVFGFKVGEQWLYAPTFFLNGDLKGHELLYIKKQDSFVPMKENWVNHLISRKPHVLGEGSSQNTQQLGGMMPNLRKFTQPPTTKTGSDAVLPVRVAEWARPFVAFVGAAATRSDSVFAKHAALAERLDLRKFLRQFPLLKAAFDKAYCAYPAIKKGFDAFYGRDFFRDMALAIRGDVERAAAATVKSAASYIIPPAKADKSKVKKKSPFLIPEDEAPEHPIKSGALRILVNDVTAFGGPSVKSAGGAKNKVDWDVAGGITENGKELTDSERERLLKDTVLVKDERDPHQVSVAYNTQVRQDLTNPTETGIYRILEKPGEFDDMVVIGSPHSGRGKVGFSVVLRKSSPRDWLNTHATNLWADQRADNPTRDSWKDYVKGLDGTDSLKEGGTYVAVHENGSGTCPFRVRESHGDGTYSVSWEEHCRWGNDRAAGMPLVERYGGYDWDDGYSSYDALVHVNQRTGCSLKSVRGELSIPSSFKIIKVSDPPKPEEDKDSIIPCCSPFDEDDGGSKKNPIKPGNLADVQLLIHSKEAKLSLHATGGNEFYAKSVFGPQRMSKKACLISLVRDHGLNELQARAIISEAERGQIRNRSANYYVKYAAGFGLQPGPTAPAIPEPGRGTEQNGPNQVASIYPQEEEIPVEGMSSQDTDPSIYDPFYEPDKGAMRVAQQASNSGQKEVFDTSMISGMLKSVRQDSLVDRYLGDLMKALDKLGRILFMFYWHQEEFEERYGKQDIPELEDSLRNAFEVLGDVVLFLMEKTVNGGAGIEMSGVGGSKSEPNIDEAARN